MNAEKFTRTGAVKIISHIMRKHKTYRNKDVDLEKSKENIILKNGSYDDLINRINEVYVYGKNGKNADKIVYLCSVCVYCPEGENPDVVLPRIKSMLDDKFGEKNCVCASIHKDEKRDHLQYAFAPICYDPKKKREKLCANDVLTQKMFQRWHTEFEDEYFKRYGEKIKLQDPDPEKRTKQNIRDIEDFKKFKEMEKEYKITKEENEILKSVNRGLSANNQILQNQNDELEKDNEEYMQANETLANQYNGLTILYEKLKPLLDKAFRFIFNVKDMAFYDAELKQAEELLKEQNQFFNVVEPEIIQKYGLDAEER